MSHASQVRQHTGRYLTDCRGHQCNAGLEGLSDAKLGWDTREPTMRHMLLQAEVDSRLTTLSTGRREGIASNECY